MWVRNQIKSRAIYYFNVKQGQSENRRNFVPNIVSLIVSDPNLVLGVFLLSLRIENFSKNVLQCCKSAQKQKDKIRPRIKNCGLVVNLISLLGVCFTVETYCLISFYTDTMNYGYLFTGTQLFSSLSWEQARPRRAPDIAC